MTADAESLAAIRARYEVFEGIDGFDDLAGRIAADSAADVPILLDALATAAAERDAEKERADRTEARTRRAIEVGERVLKRERALRARIESAPHADGCLTAWNAPGYDVKPCTCWKSAALAADQPEATPEPLRSSEDGLLLLPCGAGMESVEEWRVDHLPACGICIGNFGAPEPPHLDPEPWEWVQPWPAPMHAGRMSRTPATQREQEDYAFAPRPADEKGKAYSQDRAAYGVRS